MNFLSIIKPFLIFRFLLRWRTLFCHLKTVVIALYAEIHRDQRVGLRRARTREREGEDVGGHRA